MITLGFLDRNGNTTVLLKKANISKIRKTSVEKKGCSKNSVKVKFLVIRTRAKMKGKPTLKMIKITLTVGIKLKISRMSNQEGGNRWEQSKKEAIS